MSFLVVIKFTYHLKWRKNSSKQNHGLPVKTSNHACPHTCFHVAFQCQFQPIQLRYLHRLWDKISFIGSLKDFFHCPKFMRSVLNFLLQLSWLSLWGILEYVRLHKKLIYLLCLYHFPIYHICLSKGQTWWKQAMFLTYLVFLLDFYVWVFSKMLMWISINATVQLHRVWLIKNSRTQNNKYLLCPRYYSY